MCALWNIHEIHNAQQKENENLTHRNNNCKRFSVFPSHVVSMHMYMSVYLSKVELHCINTI